MNQKILKKVIIILLIVFICVILIAFFIMKNKAKEEKNNYLDSNNTIIPDSEEKDMWKQDKEQLEKEQETYLLEKCEDVYSYFLIKQCVQRFYSISTIQNALDIIDKDAIESLNINENNVSYIYKNFDEPEFCIDKIYKQQIDISKDLYVVYNRLKRNSKNSSSVDNSAVIIKIDKKNVTFSVYPYEYLEKFNYLNLDYDDKIKIENTSEIYENTNNKYETNLVSKDDQVCIKELYDRYKFDAKFDINGLYDKINNEYKAQKFANIEDFKKYLNQNNLSNIKEYKVTKQKGFTQYVIVCENNTYIFNASSLMDYTILLDAYTIVESEYDSYFQNAQAKYCVKRAIKAINNKDYDFVYSHLDIVQKHNKHKNIQEFKEFVDKVFYDKNAFEINDNYYEIADNVYQYNVKITDETEKEFTFKELTMTITLKESGDFSIGISN